MQAIDVRTAESIQSQIDALDNECRDLEAEKGQIEANFDELKSSTKLQTRHGQIDALLASAVMHRAQLEKDKTSAIDADKRVQFEATCIALRDKLTAIGDRNRQIRELRRQIAEIEAPLSDLSVEASTLINRRAKQYQQYSDGSHARRQELDAISKPYEVNDYD